MAEKLTAAQKSRLQYLDNLGGSARAHTAGSSTWFALERRGLIELTFHDPVNVTASITPAGRASLSNQEE